MYKGGKLISLRAGFHQITNPIRVVDEYVNDILQM